MSLAQSFTNIRRTLKETFNPDRIEGQKTYFGSYQYPHLCAIAIHRKGQWHLYTALALHAPTRSSIGFTDKKVASYDTREEVESVIKQMDFSDKKLRIAALNELRLNSDYIAEIENNRAQHDAIRKTPGLMEQMARRQQR